MKGVPVYELLGGKRRDPVEVYATALYPEETAAAVEKAEKLAERGFHGIKIKVGFDLAQDIEIVSAVRAALGADFPLMTDANMGYGLDVALAAAAAFEKLGIGWLEEPLFMEDVAGHAELKARTGVPVALGENLHTRFAFESFMARDAVDILQPDVARAGGISEVRTIAALAAEQGLPVSLHTYGDGIALAASLHLAAALENSAVMEFDYNENPLRSGLLREPLEPQQRLHAPARRPRAWASASTPRPSSATVFEGGGGPGAVAADHCVSPVSQVALDGCGSTVMAPLRNFASLRSGRTVRLRESDQTPFTLSVAPRQTAPKSKGAILEAMSCTTPAIG